MSVLFSKILEVRMLSVLIMRHFYKKDLSTRHWGIRLCSTDVSRLRKDACCSLLHPSHSSREVKRLRTNCGSVALPLFYLHTGTGNPKVWPPWDTYFSRHRRKQLRGQLKTWADTVNEDFKSLFVPQAFAWAWWEKDWGQISSWLVQDGRALGSSTLDVVNSIGDGSFTRPE